MEIAVAFIAVLILIIIAMSAKLFKNSIVRSKSQPTSYTPIKDNNTVRSKYADIIESGSLWFLSKDPENIEISSFDGTKLHAYFLPYENSKKNVILMHGYRSIGMYDFAGIFKFYQNLGFNILLPDQHLINQPVSLFLFLLPYSCFPLSPENNRSGQGQC